VPDRDHSRQVETAGCQSLTGGGEQVDTGGNVETGGRPTTASAVRVAAHPAVFDVVGSEAMPH
jgi:hypothetical protein